jgi:hypothetical protein
VSKLPVPEASCWPIDLIILSVLSVAAFSPWWRLPDVRRHGYGDDGSGRTLLSGSSSLGHLDAKHRHGAGPPLPPRLLRLPAIARGRGCAPGLLYFAAVRR